MYTYRWMDVMNAIGAFRKNAKAITEVSVCIYITKGGVSIQT